MAKFSEVFSSFNISKIAVNTIKNIDITAANTELIFKYINNGKKEKNNIVDLSEFNILKNDKSVRKNKNTETKYIVDIISLLLKFIIKIFDIILPNGHKKK